MTPKTEPTDNPIGGGGEAAPASEWLTIAEAAARFGVSARSLRRAVDRLQNSEKERGANGVTNAAGNVVRTRQITRQTKTGPRSAAAYEIALLSHLAGDLRGEIAETGQSAKPKLNAAETVSGRGQERGANAAGNVDTSAAELVDQLRGEVAFLRAALGKEQQNTAAALGELSRANERAAFLITAAGAGRLSLPPMQTAETGEAASDVVNAAPAPIVDTTQERTHAPYSGETMETGQSVKPSEKRRFWAFWKTKEGG